MTGHGEDRPNAATDIEDYRLMSREEVADRLGIAPESVRSALRRYGITEQRGYPRAEVDALERSGRGHRSDLPDNQ